MTQSTDPTNSQQKTPPAWVGKRIGNFKLLALLGQGAMGRVFRAEDVQLQRQVALKCISRKRADGKKYELEQFIREARSAAALEHPNVVRIYEVNETVDLLYIAMEMVEGGNLRELVEASGPMDVVRACTAISEAADAISYAHGMGIVHRDVKPANLMIARNGRCKLTDFGLARIDDPGDSFSLPSEAVGTPQYMAPELTSGQAATERSDVYSLGCTLWYLLIGRPPFLAPTSAEVVKMAAKQPAPDMKKLRPDLPDSVIAIVNKAMSKNPDDRYIDADQFAKALRVQTIPRGASIIGDTGSSMVFVRDHESKNKTMIIAGAAVAAVLIIVLAIVFTRGSNNSSSTNNEIATVAPTPPPPVATPVPAVIPAPAVVPAPPITAPPPTVAVTPPATPVVPPPQPVAIVEPAPEKVPAKPPVEKRTPAAKTSAKNSSKTFQATDSKELIALASDESKNAADKMITVEGVVESAAETSTGKFFRFYFVGVGRKDGFYCGYPTAFDVGTKLEKQFGGKLGDVLTGKKIRVTGTIEMYHERPQMTLRNANQIEVVK